jgi:hypothetical protein
VERNWRRLGWGAVLIVVGLAILAERFKLLPPLPLDKSWWGVLIMLLGGLALVRPRRAVDVGNGVSFLFFGAWFVLATIGAYGLTWKTSWPLALVAVGAGTVAHAIAARWLPDTSRLKLRRKVRDAESA